MHVVGWCPPALRLQAQHGGRHQHGTMYFDANQSRSVPHALRQRVGEKTLGRLIMAELCRCVGKHWVIVETIISE
jgi:hypothetical protein